MKKTNDIDELNQRINDFKKRKTASSDVDKLSPQSASKGFQMSIELVSGVFVGAAIGYFLDYVFSTKPLFLCILLVLGGIAGMLNVYKTAHADDKNGERL